MTRILLHPHLLPRSRGGARVALSHPWYWWRLKLRPSPDGVLIHQSYDDPRDVTEYSLMFDLLDDAEIHDPPAMHLTTWSEYDSYGYGDPLRPLRTDPEGEVDVVWYRRPSERWHQLPGNTCRPGDYELSVEAARQRDANGDDSTRCLYLQDMPTLRWDQVPTDDASAEGRRIAAAFRLPYPSDWSPWCNPALRPPRSLEQQYGDIYEALRNYERQMARRPSVVLINDLDYRDMLAAARASGNVFNPFEAGTDRPSTIFGLEIRVERAVPPGQCIVVDERLGYEAVGWGNPARHAYTLSDIQAVRGGFSSPPAGRGILTPNEVREREGLPPYPGWQPLSQAPNLLPESEVIDEIDRLVNESIAPGPVDDYSADRYPKCDDCHHSWHGLECGAVGCDCLNTDWLATSP